MTPQICTVDPFSRVWTVLFQDPNLWRSFSWSSCLCSVGSFILVNVDGEFVLACNHHCPTRSLDYANHNLCFHIVKFSVSSFIFLCVRHTTISYSSIDTLSESQSPHFFIAGPPHGALHIFHNFFVQKRQFHLRANLSDHNACSCLENSPRLFFCLVKSNKSPLEWARHFYFILHCSHISLSFK